MCQLTRYAPRYGALELILPEGDSEMDPIRNPSECPNYGPTIRQC